MRTDLPQNMAQIWRSGDFTGANRPIARVTIQQANINLYDFEFATTKHTSSTASPTAAAGGVELGIALGAAPLDFTDRNPIQVAEATRSGGISLGLPMSNTTGEAGVGLGTGAGLQSDGTVHQTYASLIFGSAHIPKELPNVAGVQWQRALTQDLATATLKFYNTAPMPIGTVPERDIELIGNYTYNRGATSFSNRWGTTPNEWSGILMPDNIIRTYEGYGFDAEQAPEKDPHLMLTGTWMIDKVEYTHDGVINVTCRDVGRILSDQIIFVPVIPSDFYPVSFAASNAHVGLVGPITFSYTTDDTGNHDPNHPPPPDWPGPMTAPTGLTVSSGDDSIIVAFDPVDISGLPPAGDTTIGYVVKGYRLMVDGVVLPRIYDETAWIDSGTGKVTIPVPSDEIINGNVYEVRAIAVYKQHLTRNGELHFKTNVQLEQDGDASSAVWGYPGVATAPTVVSLGINVNGAGTLAPGHVGLTSINDHGSAATWTLIAYDSDSPPGEVYTFTTTTTVGATTADFNISSLNPDIEDLTFWNFLAYGEDAAGNVGSGQAQYASSTPGAFYLPPVDGAPPHDPGPAPTAPIVTKKKDGKKNGITINVPLRQNETDIDYLNASNTFSRVHVVQPGDTLWDLARKYFGDAEKYHVIYRANEKLIRRKAQEHGFNSDFPHWIFPGEHLKIPSTYGHSPRDAFDHSLASYWLSDGHGDPNRSGSFEWIEGSLNRVTLTQLKFNTRKSHYKVYVSVFAKGRWVKHKDRDVIPYKALDAKNNNGSRIPFCEELNVEDTKDHDGDVMVTFRTPIPGATKVRLTFTNLQKFDNSDRPYHVAIQNIRAFATAGDGDGTTTGHGGAGGGSTKTPAPVVTGPPQDDNDGSIVKSYTDYIPAHFDIGAGGNPGQYQDYTDIVKMFCAWGGLFWPEGAEQILSDGSAIEYDFGTTDYGLSNIDPVLGGDGSGRVWGDFAQTGTAGPAMIPVNQWDKQTLLDGISYIRDIIGFIFFIDETGGAVWRMPNTYSVGNWLSAGSNGSPSDQGAQGGRTSTLVEIDEEQTLIGLTATLDSSNVRERVFVATVSGSLGALAKGWNPNPIGLRRVAGWTDQHFQSDAECQVMADLIALRQLFLYRTDTLTIPAYPAIQVDDQVRIFEKVTGEAYIHYVQGISSTLDMEQGAWTYQLQTQWLGEEPGQLWIFNPSDLSEETQTYLSALTIPAGAALETDV